MKKSLISLFLLPLALAACTSANPSPKPADQNNPIQNNDVEDNTSDNQNQEETSTENEENNPIEEEEKEEEEDPIHEEDEEEEENENTGENEGNPQENTGISLDEWKEYEFHEGHEPAYHPDWDFYYGTTFEPISNCLWENPNEKVDYSGIEFFDKKQYMESPIFNSYPKVEVRFEFWFSSHQSSKYKATDNEPQFKIDEYNSANKLINTDSIEIAKSDVPKNNTALKKTLYIKQNTMTHFNIKFNNFIANGDSGYTAILCKISLKGWQYE